MQSISNGTPPYDAQVYHGGSLVAALTDVPASSLNGGAAPGGYAAASPGTTITVTDALGCTAQGSAMTPAVHAVQPTFVTSLDCTTGQTTLRCTGFTDWYGGGAAYAPCDWPGRTCSVNGTNMGAVSSSWVNEGGGVWRFGQALGSGGYNFVFSGTNLPCNSALECWGNMFVNVTEISPGDCGVNFRLRAALDGALPSGSLMTDGLRAANLVPTMQPYTALGYTFVGSPTNITITPAQLAVTGNDAIVDWMIVELRNAATPTTIVYSKPALLQRDGDVVDTDGNVYVNCPIPAGDYHVAVKHRNHLGIMTANALPLSVDPYGTMALVDLRSSFMGTYGTNARVLKGSVWCMWAGDATGNGTLKYTGAGNDRDAILTAIGGGTPTNT
ncbi:MAG TPA: hypothetical protein PKE21_17585, partial [Flavobacteriales bacterium]|nr:hypothetical protein [Flavobacteriales bacterium]